MSYLAILTGLIIYKTFQLKFQISFEIIEDGVFDIYSVGSHICSNKANKVNLYWMSSMFSKYNITVSFMIDKMHYSKTH